MAIRVILKGEIMAMIDTRQTINGCRIWFEHTDERKAKIEAGNYKVYLRRQRLKRKVVNDRPN